MVIDLLVRVVNSQDVRSSIDRVIKGEPFDIERKMLIDKPYIEYLELLYSRKFRKYWINGKIINLINIYLIFNLNFLL